MLNIEFKNLKMTISSVQSFSCVWILIPHGLQHARLACPSPTPGACSNSCPSSQWCHPTIFPLSTPFPPAFSLSQPRGLFQWVSSLHQLAKVLELQHLSFQWIFRTDWYPCSPKDSQESSPTPQFKSINSSALSLLHGPTLTSIHTWLLEKP